MSAARRLLITADDFGLSPAVSDGITESIRNGIVTATSAMLCVEGAAADLARRREALAGRIGLHLQLTGGRPRAGPAAARALTGPAGAFPANRAALREFGPAPDAAALEWRAQYRALRQAGIVPSHLDSHHHVHGLERLRPRFLDLAAATGLAARALDPAMRADLRRAGLATADHCETGWYGAAPGLDRLLGLLERAWTAMGGHGTIELMCHPGFVDDGLRARSRYVEERAQELALLCSDRLAAALDAAGIARIGPAALAPAGGRPAMIDKPAPAGSLSAQAAKGGDGDHGDGD